MATIDVILPVKNGISFLAESLDSVCAQSFQDWRLLVLDHGSTDGSREMAEQYHERDPRVVLHSFPDADGLSGLLNKGLEISDCRYVMRHDADDICHPRRMDISLAAFRESPGCVAIGGQAEIIDGKGARIGDMKMPVGVDRVGASAFFRNPIAHPTVMLDFAEIKRMGVRYGNDFLNVLPQEQHLTVKNLAEDYFLFGQLAIQGKCNNVPEQLIQYRWHGNNVGARRFGEQVELSLAISRYLARNFTEIHGQQYFDPAPFCSHGGLLLDVDGKSDFSEQFEHMAQCLRAGFNHSPEVERELDYRRVTAKRHELQLLWRYLMFRSTHVPEAGEWHAVRSWALRRIPGRIRMKAPAESLA